MKELFGCALAGTVFFGLALNLYLGIKERNSDSTLLAIWKHFSFYTILTNWLVLLWMLTILFLPSSPAGDLVRNSNVSAAVTFYIVSVGVGNYLIFGIRPLRPINQFADALVHGVVPASVFMYWFFFSEKSSLAYHLLALWLVYPLSYAVYTAAHGVWSRFYPYPFTNVEELGVLRVSLNAVGLSIAVLAGGAAFVGLGRALSGL